MRKMKRKAVARARIGPVVHEPVDVAAIRKKTGLSQPAFAAAYGIGIWTLRQWEQGKRGPDGTARTLLRMIEKAPGTVRELIEADA